MTPLDWRKIPIFPGSSIVYPGRRGSNVWMNEAIVTKVTDGPNTRLVVERVDNHKRVTLTNLHNVTVLE